MEDKIVQPTESSEPLHAYEAREQRQRARQARLDKRIKKCAKCGERKVATEFGLHKDASDGRQSYCKVCKNGLGKRRQERNVGARLKHHMATRIATQLGVHAPPNLTRDLETYLGYSMTKLTNALAKELKEREGVKLRDALQDGYHIDHIHPLSKFDVVAEGRVNWDVFKDCWAIDNLMAIPAAENLAKGARILDES